jgi:hypothetical protein
LKILSSNGFQNAALKDILDELSELTSREQLPRSTLDDLITALGRIDQPTGRKIASKLEAEFLVSTNASLFASLVD